MENFKDVLNGSGETTVELVTQDFVNRLFFYIKLNVFGNFISLLEDL